MERRLRTTADLLEILLNFMLILGAETAADAAFGGFSAPVYALFIPLAAPLLFYAARKWSGNLLLFLAIHAAAVAALGWLGGLLPVPLLWKIVFTAVGIVYAVCSVRIRLTGKTDGEGELAPGFLAVAAVALFFGCSRLGSQAGCERILWLALLWFPGSWLKNYLENFLDYMKMNRRAAGAMPEKRIFEGGISLVFLYCSGCLAILALCSKTALVARMSELVRSAGFWLLKMFFSLLMLFAAEEEDGELVVSGGEGGANPMMYLPEAEEAPLWLQILDKILVTAVAVAIIAGLALVIIMLIRTMIERFYGRERKKKEIRQEGFVEEEERLERKKEERSRRVPMIGGTPEERVRRSFKKAVAETLRPGGGFQKRAVFAGKGQNAGTGGGLPGEEGRSGAGSDSTEELSCKTARELAVMCSAASETDEEGWKALTGLYERARYAQAAVTKEDARAAGRLAAKLRRQG